MVEVWSDQDSVHSSSKRCRIAHIIHMSDEPAPSLDLDELVDETYKCLAQFRKRDMPDSLERTIVDSEKVINADNAKRLQALIVTFQDAIRDHDDRLEAAATSNLLAARCVMRALGGGAESRRQRGLQGSVGDGGGAGESAAMRTIRRAGQCGGVTAICARRAYTAASAMWSGRWRSKFIEYA
jgi:hypothetical protein